MKTYLFLDDWMVDGYRDMVRRFGRPQPAPVPYYEGITGYSRVIFDPATGTYRCWYSLVFDGERRRAFALAESEDGYHWHPAQHGGPTDPAVPNRTDCLYLPEKPDGSGVSQPYVTFRDDLDEDPSRRYKSVDYHGWLLFSPDGIRWRLDPACRAFVTSSGSDTMNHIYWNPVKNRYQVHFRHVNVDRRIAMSHSEDLRNWTFEGIVFQPDAQDPPLLQIYHMPVLWYEDLFLALPALFRVPDNETGRRWKMWGHIETGFAYSYNGFYWLRPYHEPLLPITAPGTYGAGNNSPASMVLGPDDVLRIYTGGRKPQHGTAEWNEIFRRRGEQTNAMLMHTLRKDGFAYLEPMGGWGWMRTRALLPQAADLAINVEAPIGQMLVQVTDEKDEPIPGFTFEDCVPFQGDGVAVKPQWKEHKLDELVGKPCHLEFKLFGGRLYAYRWTSQTFYAKEPQDRI